MKLSFEILISCLMISTTLALPSRILSAVSSMPKQSLSTKRFNFGFSKYRKGNVAVTNELGNTFYGKTIRRGDSVYVKPNGESKYSRIDTDPNGQLYLNRDNNIGAWQRKFMKHGTSVMLGGAVLGTFVAAGLTGGNNNKATGEQTTTSITPSLASSTLGTTNLNDPYLASSYNSNSLLSSASNSIPSSIPTSYSNAGAAVSPSTHTP
ncbi:hypothetical protein ROZALSC1DRAFT_21060 [Rozella allomycis CSF55]|uniref:Uncharacterized protein n=1 Tax=Rozella allomycis (strain CSF55) TaxID=988480 RepID=A0A4P9YMX5_ROZAC|nr:hypothetical protein ROZALSC1DRAFT_21060 [Rozella allomycis CSF55]